MLRTKLVLFILLSFLSINSLAQEARGPLNPTVTAKNLTTEVEASLDLGNLDVEQTAVTIAKDYPGEYNMNQVSEVYDALRKGWYYYSDPSYKDKYKSANRTLQDGKISNSIGMGDCDDFAILMASLLESLQGSTRIIFAYDQDTRLNHAYAEVYLGKNSDPRMDELIGWLKDEYNQTEIQGRTVAGDEVWLNLDYNSTYPGGPYFGGQRVVREVVWRSTSRSSPKIVPIIDTMDSIAGWKRKEDEKGSNVSISSVPSPKGKAIQMDFDLKDGGKVGISRNVSGSMLSQINGINFSYYGLDRQILVQLELVYNNGTRFGYSWKPESGNKWKCLEALFEDFSILEPRGSSESVAPRLDLSKVAQMEILCQRDKKDSSETVRIIIDHIRGVINIPPGSPWEEVENKRLKTLALQEALGSNQLRAVPGKLIESTEFAVQSLEHSQTGEGDKALRECLKLLPCLISLMLHNDTVNSITFSPDGSRIATASDDNTARIWDASTGKELARVKHADLVIAVSFSPDGSKIATASFDNTMRIWDAYTGKQLARLKRNGAITAVSFSPDGNRIATASLDSTVRVWDASTGKELARVKHDDDVLAVSFSPDGRKIATASSDKTARVWDASTGEELAKIKHDDYVTAISFSPDGKRIAIASGNSAYIHTLVTKDLICEACSRLTCNLAVEDWKKQYCCKCGN